MIPTKTDKSVLKQLPPPPPGRLGWPWDSEVSPEVYASRQEWPLISIVTPSYNQRDFIEETIRSVLLQNYPNLEFIIMDGKSSDDTVSVIRTYDHWLSFWESKGDKGQSHAINKGISMSTGQIFNWLCSDDILYPGALLQVGQAFMENKSLKGYVGGIEILLPNEEVAVAPNLIKGSWEDTLKVRLIKQQSFFHHMSAVARMGPLNENLDYVMDVDWRWRFYSLYGEDQILEGDKIIAGYRFHEDSKTIGSSQQFIEEDIALMLSISQRFGFNNLCQVFSRLVNSNKGISFPNLEAHHDRIELIESALHYRSLKLVTQIYDEQQFLLAKALIPILNDYMPKYAGEDEKKMIHFLRREVSGKPWIWYKAKRFLKMKLSGKFLEPELNLNIFS